MPVHPAYPGSGQVLFVPSRSIPNMSTAEQQDWRDQDTPLAVPSKKKQKMVTVKLIFKKQIIMYHRRRQNQKSQRPMTAVGTELS